MIVGRDADITIGHSKVSGNHLVMKIGTVTDSSSFGTFLLLKTYEEATTGLQSQFIKFQSGLHLVSVGYYDLELN